MMEQQQQQQQKKELLNGWSFLGHGYESPSTTTTTTTTSSSNVMFTLPRCLPQHFQFEELQMYFSPKDIACLKHYDTEAIVSIVMDEYNTNTNTNHHNTSQEKIKADWTLLSLTWQERGVHTVTQALLLKTMGIMPYPYETNDDDDDDDDDDDEDDKNGNGLGQWVCIQPFSFVNNNNQRQESNHNEENGLGSLLKPHLMPWTEWTVRFVSIPVYDAASQSLCFPPARTERSYPSSSSSSSSNHHTFQPLVFAKIVDTSSMMKNKTKVASASSYEYSYDVNSDGEVEADDGSGHMYGDDDDDDDDGIGVVQKKKHVVKNKIKNTKDKGKNEQQQQHPTFPVFFKKDFDDASSCPIPVVLCQPMNSQLITTHPMSRLIDISKCKTSSTHRQELSSVRPSDVQHPQYKPKKIQKVISAQDARRVDTVATLLFGAHRRQPQQPLNSTFGSSTIPCIARNLITPRPRATNLAEMTMRDQAPPLVLFNNNDKETYETLHDVMPFGDNGFVLADLVSRIRNLFTLRDAMIQEKRKRVPTGMMKSTANMYTYNPNANYDDDDQ